MTAIVGDMMKLPGILLGSHTAKAVWALISITDPSGHSYAVVIDLRTGLRSVLK